MSDEEQLKWELEWRDRAERQYRMADEWEPDVSLDYAFNDAMTFHPEDLDAEVEPLRQVSPEELAEALGLLMVENPECICRYDQFSPGRRQRTAACPEHGDGDRAEAFRLGHDPNFNPRGAKAMAESLLRFLGGDGS